MEYWRCAKVDQRKRRDRPRCEIEGREILPGTSSSTVVSYGGIMWSVQVAVPNPRARVTTPSRAAIVAAYNIRDIVEREKEMI